MADTFTANLRLRKPEVNANNNAWAALLNEMITSCEQSIAGAAIADVSGGNVTLSTANGSDDNARRMFIYVTGNPAVTTRTVTVPDTPKVYVVVNDTSTAKQVTITRVSGGTTLIVRPGQSCIVIVTSAGIFEVPPQGNPVVDAAVATALTLDIGGTHGAGDATVGIKYVVQGSIVFVKMNSFNALNFSVTGFTLDRTGGIDWPAEMVPALAVPIPTYVNQNGTLVEANIVTSTSGATPWSIVRADGAAWLGTGTDDRACAAISFCYPLRGF